MWRGDGRSRERTSKPNFGTKKPWKVPEPILRQMELEETVMLLNFPGVRGGYGSPRRGLAFVSCANGPQLQPCSGEQLDWFPERLETPSTPYQRWSNPSSGVEGSSDRPRLNNYYSQTFRHG